MLGNSCGRLDLSDQHLHLIGILGTGMKALANYALECGASVTGSDVRPSPVLKELAERGVQVQLDQEEAAIDPATNLVVVSQAITDDNPQLRAARNLGLEVVKYPELLGLLMEAQKGIAVAGAHGKSTTASAIAYIMRCAGADPSFLIGADVPQLGGGSHYGRGEHLVVEACEYKRSFLYLAPHIGVITNIDAEHLDYYYDLGDIQEAFCDFVDGIDEDGVLVVNADDENSREVVEAARCEVITCGIDCKKATYKVDKLWRAKKHSNCNLIYKGKDLGRFSLKLYGKHNVQNALMAIAVCRRAGLDFDQVKEPLARFDGAARRLQLLGEPWNVAILSDYAHHPKEIRASIGATQQRFPKRRIFCVFEPHQYSRTREMLPQLAASFEGTWVTLVSDIYAARDTEEDRSAVSAMDLVRAINENGQIAHYVPDFEDIEEILVADVVPQDVVLVMGAGDIWQIAHNLCGRVEMKRRKQRAA